MIPDCTREINNMPNVIVNKKETFVPNCFKFYSNYCDRRGKYLALVVYVAGVDKEVTTHISYYDHLLLVMTKRFSWVVS